MPKDEADKEPQAPSGAPVRGVPIKLVMIIGVAALVIGLGATFTILKFTSQDKHDVAQAAPAPTNENRGESSSQKTPAVTGQMFDMEPFIVNLSDAPEIRYLKLTMKLELEKDGVQNAINARMPQLRDAILVLLSSKDSTALRTTQGKFQLRDELTQRVNSALPKKIVRTVYFTEFVLQ
jgi:flagellar FliL protein